MNAVERETLRKISRWYSNQHFGFYTKLVQMGFRTLEPFFRAGNVLEVGPADGEMTKMLLMRFRRVSVVDAAERYVRLCRRLSKRVTGHVSLIEHFRPPERYDNIVLAHILEHVVRPTIVLRRLKNMLTQRGRLFIIVPNADSLHRLVGVKMGLLAKSTELNDADRSVDHKRVYTFKLLKQHIVAANLRLHHWGGIFLKPLSNQQIHRQWSPPLIEGYFQLGKDFPEITSELFAVCGRH